MRSYQNQTAEDIESGRARMDSVTSYGSGGSEEALLASDASFASSNPSRLQTSPRRTNRENLPLLRGRGHQRLQDYEDIDLDNLNVFTGKFFTFALTITLVQPCTHSLEISEFFCLRFYVKSILEIQKFT